jgi:transposase
LSLAPRKWSTFPPNFPPVSGCFPVGNERKNDRLDALYIALAAWRGERLREVKEEEYDSVLKMLSGRREDLVEERTRALNRLLYRLLRDLLPGGAPNKLSTDEAARALPRLRPRSAPERTRRDLAWELVLRHVRRLDRLVCELDRRIKEAIKESGRSLNEIFGVGPLLAAKIIGRVGTIARFPSKGHFASYTGTAPIEASSGDVVRHRLSRFGDRQLNAALHIIGHLPSPPRRRGPRLLPA